MRYDKQYRKKFGRVANLNEKEQLYASIADKTLGIADTWEFRLSASHGVNKRGVWEQALRDKVVGPFALIRNLRNMIQEGVDDRLIHDSLIEAKSEKILPFRFLAALRAAPQYAGELEKMMLQNLEDQPKLKGRTILLVDVSGSMDRKLSDKSDLNRRDAAAGLAIMVREVCESCRVFSFAYRTVEIPAYRGLGLADAIVRSQTGATYLYDAVALANLEQHDRLIVITDEQANGSRQGERADAPKAIPGPRATGYIVNVASYQSGIGYGPWTQIDGWSEKVVDFIREYEREDITQD